jgi:hypothetical protein
MPGFLDCLDDNADALQNKTRCKLDLNRVYVKAITLLTQSEAI